MELDETGSRRFFRIRPFSRRPWKTERMKTSPSPPPSTRLRLTEGRALVLAGIVLSALNLRTAVTSITPLLDELGRVFGFGGTRSEEHTSELQSLMRISYAVFCLKKKRTTIHRSN